MPCIYSFNGEQQPVGPHLPLLSQFKDQLIWSNDVLSENGSLLDFLICATVFVTVVVVVV